MTGGEIRLCIGLGMSSGMYDWINAAWSGQELIKSGAVVAMASDGSVLTSYEFANASIREVAIPTLDASSKDPLYVSLKIQPEDVVQRKGSGQRLGADGASPTIHRWTLTIPDVDTTSVQKVEIPVWKVKTSLDEDLKVTIPAAAVNSWQDWLGSGDSRDALLSDGVGTIQFGNVHLRDLGPAESTQARWYFPANVKYTEIRLTRPAGE